MISMISKIKETISSVAIMAGLLFAVYMFGKRKGRNDERLKNAETVQKNVSKAMRARALLDNPDFVRRLREKYRRR